MKKLLKIGGDPKVIRPGGLSVSLSLCVLVAKGY